MSRYAYHLLFISREVLVGRCRTKCGSDLLFVWPALLNGKRPWANVLTEKAGVFLSVSKTSISEMNEA